MKLRFITFGLLLITGAVYAQDEWALDEWEEVSEEPASVFTGFGEIALGGRVSSDEVISTDKTLADIRVQLQWDKDFDDSGLKFIADLYYDGVLEETRIQLRELAWQGNLGFLEKWGMNWGKKVDLKAGQQVLTWGTGDYVFLNDLFPKDFQSFFAGRNDDYLKAPSLSAKFSGFFDWANIDVVIIPEFTPDNYINGEYFSFFSPFAQENVAPRFSVDSPLQPGSPEYAVRIYKSIAGNEYALYGYRGFYKTPSSFTEFAEPWFAELSVYGASLIRPFASGLLNAEVAYYYSLDDKQGTNPLVPNSQTRWLLGYEQELLKNLNLSVQWYAEQNHDYEKLQSNSSYPDLEPEKLRVVLTQRLRYQAMQQTLTLNAFNFYSTSDEDGYLKVSVDYSPVDQWQLSIGANAFYGKENYTFFGQFKDASNLFARFKYYY